MTNWFQDHPTTSIISYTLVVSAATWATSTFVLQDNRLNLAKSEVESQKTLVEQYKSKTELLQKDIEVIRAENIEYKNWLSQSKDAIPIIVPQLLELRKQIAQLKATSTANDFAREDEKHQTAKEQPTSPVYSKLKPLPRLLSEPRLSRLGSAAVDEATGVIVTVKQTFTDRTALLILALPDREKNIEERVYAGKRFAFTWAGNKLFLTVKEINFLSDSVVFIIQPANT